MFKKKKNKIKEYRVYSSIDTLPLWNYQQIIDKDDLSYLLKLDDYLEKPNIDIDKLQQTWDVINCEIIDTFGITDKYRVILKLEHEIVKFRLKAAVESDKTLETVADIKEKELKQQLEQNKTMKIDELIAVIETNFKFQLDEHKTTVKKFYSYLKLMERANR